MISSCAQAVSIRDNNISVIKRKYSILQQAAAWLVFELPKSLSQMLALCCRGLYLNHLKKKESQT